MWLEIDEREVRLMDLNEYKTRTPAGVEDVPFPDVEYQDVVVARQERTQPVERDAVRDALLEFQRNEDVLPQRWETFRSNPQHAHVWTPDGQAQSVNPRTDSVNMVAETQRASLRTIGPVRRVSAEVKATVTAKRVRSEQKRVRSEHQRDVRRYRAGVRHPNGRGL